MKHSLGKVTVLIWAQSLCPESGAHSNSLGFRITILLAAQCNIPPSVTRSAFRTAITLLTVKSNVSIVPMNTVGKVFPCILELQYLELDLSVLRGGQSWRLACCINLQSPSHGSKSIIERFRPRISGSVCRSLVSSISSRSTQFIFQPFQAHC